jgi:protein O-mannosyl-transferase
MTIMNGKQFHVPAAVAALVVGLLTCIAYGNSFDGEFVMDDISEIALNPAMEQLFPPWKAMFVGRLLPARPLPYLTFAVNSMLCGPHPFGYHVFNLVIHVTSALALFSFARLTFLSPRLNGVYGDRATILAAIIATFWAVHPLQTQAVTYVYQRIESLTGMFCLLALMAFARAAARDWSTRWQICCIMSTAAAMSSKENAVVLPLLIASYDWLFCGEGLAGFTRRRWFYAGLAATWVILGLFLASQSGRYGEFQRPAHDPIAYALTQPRVILHYLRLAAIPSPLCFDYIWRTAETWSEFLPSLVYLLVLLAVTAAGAARQRPWSWLGLAFFLTLAPTSSVMPVVALAAEHRMYLPLAAFVATVVLIGDWVVRRQLSRKPGARLGLTIATSILVCLWTTALIAMTRARNEVYAEPGGIWLDVLAKQPTSTRALWNLAAPCEKLDEIDAALRYADECFVLNPRLPVFLDLAAERRKTGDIAGAMQILQHGLAQYRAIPTPHEPAIGEQSARLDTELHELSSPGDAGKAVASEPKPIPGHSNGP